MAESTAQLHKEPVAVRCGSSRAALPGGGGPAENGDIPPLEAAAGECDGYPYRLTYGLRPYESVIFELPGETE